MILPLNGISKLIEAIKALPDVNPQLCGVSTLETAQKKLNRALADCIIEVTTVVNNLEGEWSSAELKRVQHIGQEIIDRLNNLHV